MMAGGNNALLSEEELAAALAEVEQLSGADGGGLPSLDESAAPPAVMVPVPNLQLPGAADAPAPAVAKAPAAPPAPTPSPAPKAVAKAEPSKPAPAKTASQGKTETGSAAGAAAPRPSLGQRIYRALDTLLDWINWPFIRLGESVRGLIGSIGVVTLVLSLLAMFILPRFHADRDPLGFLRRRPPPAATADAGHGAAPKAEAHGGGH